MLIKVRSREVNPLPTNMYCDVRESLCSSTFKGLRPRPSLETWTQPETKTGARYQDLSSRPRPSLETKTETIQTTPRLGLETKRPRPKPYNQDQDLVLRPKPCLET